MKTIKLFSQLFNRRETIFFRRYIKCRLIYLPRNLNQKKSKGIL